MDAAAGQTSPTERSRIFLSYSRKDTSFTQKLATALTQRGYVADFDQSEHDPANIATGISAEDDWWERLREMIAAAEAMVLIVSPHSAASQVCGEEIAYARALGKRIIPVLLSPIDFEKAPPRLAALNVKLSFTDEAAFEASVAALIAVLEVDVAWHREGARLSALALTWDGEGRSESRLLSAGAVTEAEAWAARRPANAPLPGELLMSYLAVGRAKAEIDRERLLVITGRAFVKPARHALDRGDASQALRLNAASMLLAQDLSGTLVPERLTQGHAFRAILENRRRMTLDGPVGRWGGARFGNCGVLWVAYGNDGVVAIHSLHAPSESIQLAAGGHVEKALFSFDDRFVAVSLELEKVIVWRVSDQREVLRFDGLGWMPVLATSPTSSQLALINGADCELWDIETGVRVANAPCGMPIRSLQYTPDGAHLVAFAKDGTVQIWDVKCLDLCAEYKHSSSFTHNFTNGRLLLADQRDGGIRVLDVLSAKETVSLKIGEHPLADAAISADGARLVTLDFENKARLHDLGGGCLIDEWGGPTSKVHCIGLSPDGARFFTVCDDCTICIYDTKSGRLIASLVGHDELPSTCTFSSGGHFLVSASPEDGRVVVWDVYTSLLKRRVQLLQKSCSRVATSADKALMALADEDGRICVVRTSDWTTVRQEQLEGRVTALAIGPGGTPLVAGLEKGGVVIWNGAEITRLDAHSAQVHDLALNSDCTRLLSSSQDKSARLWDVGDGALLATFSHEDAVWRGRFLTSRHEILTSCRTNLCLLWDIATQDRIRELNLEGAYDIALDASGDIVLTSSFFGAYAWNLGTGDRLWRSFEEIGQVWSVSFSSDHAFATAAGRNTPVKVIHVQTGGEIASLTECKSAVVLACLSADAGELWAVDESGEAFIWDMGRLAAFREGFPELLTAALANGEGVRTERDRYDLLLSAAPDNLHASLQAQMDPLQSQRASELVSALRRSLDQGCYALQCSNQGSDKATSQLRSAEASGGSPTFGTDVEIVPVSNASLNGLVDRADLIRRLRRAAILSLVVLGIFLACFAVAYGGRHFY